nr:transcription factor MYB124-like [Ipomoea batatas]
MKKKAGTTNGSEASKPKARHIVSWSQEAQRIFGNRWTEIAKVISGGTDNAVKNRFTTLCKKRAKNEALAKKQRSQIPVSPESFSNGEKPLDIESGLQSTHFGDQTALDDEFAKGIFLAINASTSQ